MVFVWILQKLFNNIVSFLVKNYFVKEINFFWLVFYCDYYSLKCFILLYDVLKNIYILI